MKLYVIGTMSDSEVEVLLKAGHRVEMDTWHNDLRSAIVALTTTKGVCLADDWWTTSRGQMLQTIAGWLRFKHFDPVGKPVETRSMSSRSSRNANR